MWTFLERLRFVILALIFVILITGFLVFPEQVATLAESIANQEQYIRVLLVLGALLTDALLLYAVYRQFRSGGRFVKGLLVRSSDANVEISLESIEENLNTAIRELDDIHRVETDATSERGRVAIKMTVAASDKVDVRQKTEQINREIKRIVEKRMGLQLRSKPNIQFDLVNPATIHQADQSRKNPLGGLFGRDKSPEPAEPASPPPVQAAPSPAPAPSTSESGSEVFEVSSTQTDETEVDDKSV